MGLDHLEAGHGVEARQLAEAMSVAVWLLRVPMDGEPCKEGERGRSLERRRACRDSDQEEYARPPSR